MRKTRKFLSVFLGIILLSISLFFASGTNIYDEKLSFATKIAAKYFGYDDKDGMRHLYSNYIKGVGGEEDFILITVQQGGYMLLTSDTFELVEYSEYGNSPYSDYNLSDSYYAGPGNYFAQTKLGLANINTKKVLSEDERKILSSVVKDKITEINKSQKKQENELAVENNEISPFLETTPGNTGNAIYDIDDYFVVSRRYIPNYQYFLAQPDHGYNNDNSCTTVATQLLLGYHDWASDGRLITDGKFSNISPTATNPYDSNAISTTDAFYEYLKPKTKFSVLEGGTTHTVKNGINTYIAEHAPSLASGIDCNYYFVSEDILIQAEIMLGNPCLAGIYSYIEGKQGMHMVVVYGYQVFNVNNVETMGYIAHFGWKNNNGEQYYNVWFNKSWVIDYLYLHVNTHEHQDIYLDNNAQHVLKCTICDRLTHDNDHNGSRSFSLDANYHKKICSCGYVVEEKGRHNFQYVPYSAIYHEKICSDCGKRILEEHTRKSKYCFYCGGDMPIE